MDLVKEAASRFQLFALRVRDIEAYTLSDYIQAWVRSGEAIRETGGNYVLFMRVVAYVFAWFHEDPDDWANVNIQCPMLKEARQISDVAAIEEDELPPFFNPDEWQRQVFSYRPTD